MRIAAIWSGRHTRMQESTPAATARTVCSTSGVPPTRASSLSAPNLVLEPPPTTIMAREIIRARVHSGAVTAASDLHHRLRESRGGLVFTPHGELVDDVDTSTLTAPTLLVEPVNDALKRLSPDGLVLDHLDRDKVWRVVAYFLDDQTAHTLGTEAVDIAQIHQRVAEIGPGWHARPIADV